MTVDKFALSAEIAVRCAKIARREDPLSQSARIDRIYAQEQYLWQLCRDEPDMARIAAEWRSRSEYFSELAGVSTDTIGRYARIVENQLRK